MIDIKAIKAAAEAATPQPWIEPGEGNMPFICMLTPATVIALCDEIERLCDETGQLQEQNRWLDEKLAEAEKDAFTKSAQICQDWIEDHSKADNCTYNDCDMVAAVTDVRTAILQLQHLNRGST